jgi:hypothetical protein
MMRWEEHSIHGTNEKCINSFGYSTSEMSKRKTKEMLADFEAVQSLSWQYVKKGGEAKS